MCERPDGPAAGGRGFLAAIASAFSSVVGGASHSLAPTADADSGAGPRGSFTADVPAPKGDAFTAPSADAEVGTPANRRGRRRRLRCA